MPDSCANALRPTPGQAGGSGWPNAYAAHNPNRRAQARSSGSPSTAASLTPNPYRNARMHDSKSALPARSPIPFTQVLIQASWPASRSPSAPDTEFATAMPRSLWQCVSTGMPTAEASFGEPLPDPPGGVATSGVAVPHPRRAGVPGRERELKQIPVVGPRPVLRVDPDAVFARRASGTTQRLLRNRHNPDEVERLARRGRPRRPAGVADITIESAITEITSDRLRFRGLDDARLAVSRTFEEVAELLWTGELRSAREPELRSAREPELRSAREPELRSAREPWQARSAALAVGRAAQGALPAGTLPLERLQVIVPAMAATDPLRLQLDPAAVTAGGRSIIAGMVDCLPSGDTSCPGDSVAERLWSRLGDRRASPALVARAVRCAGPAGRSRARRLYAGRPGRRRGAGRSVRRGRDRLGSHERGAARRGIARCGDPDGRGPRSG